MSSGRGSRRGAETRREEGKGKEEEEEVLTEALRHGGKKEEGKGKEKKFSRRHRGTEDTEVKRDAYNVLTHGAPNT
jgi:hypothetical protein